MKKPLRPHLVRAYYDWFVANAAVPYVAVDTTHPDILLPEKHMHASQLTLNVSPNAVEELKFSETQMEFLASFGGEVARIRLPMGSILSIYDQRTGIGTVFEKEHAYEVEKKLREKQIKSSSGLRVVK